VGVETLGLSAPRVPKQPGKAPGKPPAVRPPPSFPGCPPAPPAAGTRGPETPGFPPGAKPKGPPLNPSPLTGPKGWPGQTPPGPETRGFRPPSTGRAGRPFNPGPQGVALGNPKPAANPGGLNGKQFGAPGLGTEIPQRPWGRPSNPKAGITGIPVPRGRPGPNSPKEP